MTRIVLQRRRLLHGAALAAGVALPALPVRAMPSLPAGHPGSRPGGHRDGYPAGYRLALRHLHTRERIDRAHAVGGPRDPIVQAAFDHFLRDHYSGRVGRIDPQLLDLLCGVHRLTGADRPFEVISGYRCPETNERLRRTRDGGVASRSLHLEGRAIDVRLPGVPLATLRDAARELHGGGVGFYPREGFVHIDTGRVRYW
ncbi:MAG: YcbK family protein [Lautropia sp.]